MKKFITNKITLSVTGIILLLLVWWLISACIGNGSRVFPDPWMTFAKFFDLIKEKETYYHLGYTFQRMIDGFLMAAIAAIIVGIIVGNIKPLKTVFNPTIIAFKSIPTAALVYVFLVLIGAKNTPIFIVALISFPIIYESVVGGFNNIDPKILEAVRLDSGNTLTANLRIKFPLSLPYLFVGLTSSFALSFKLEIMAEVISGSTSYGLGNIIRYTQQNDASDLLTIFAYSLIAIIFMMLLSLIAFLVKKRFAKQLAMKA